MIGKDRKEYSSFARFVIKGTQNPNDPKPQNLKHWIKKEKSLILAMFEYRYLD